MKLPLFHIACSLVRSEHFLGILVAPFPRSWQICIFTLRIEIRNSGCRAKTRCSDTAEVVERVRGPPKWNRWIAGSPDARIPESPNSPNPRISEEKMQNVPAGQMEEAKNQRTRTRPKCSQANKFKNVWWISIADKFASTAEEVRRWINEWMANNERRGCW